ncbi:MAG: hypothetical protein NVS2B5_03070 [Beijerinckiaceae bacterium]
MRMLGQASYQARNCLLDLAALFLHDQHGGTHLTNPRLRRFGVLTFPQRDLYALIVFRDQASGIGNGRVYVFQVLAWGA